MTVQNLLEKMNERAFGPAFQEYCDDLPHPTREHEAFIEQGVERLLEVLSISNGKALVLFTAKADMEEVYSILSTKKSSVQGFNSAAGIIAGQGSE